MVTMADINSDRSRDETGGDNDASHKTFKSIRRSSFVDSYYNIKEEADEQDVSDEVSDVSSLSTSKPQVGGDGDDWQYSEAKNVDESKRSLNPFDGEDISKNKPVFDRQASENTVEFDAGVLNELKASTRLTVKRSNVSDRKDSAQDPVTEPPRSPPSFPSRRKGSMERRMLLKAGLGLRAANEKLARHTMFEKRKSNESDEGYDPSMSRRNSTGSNNHVKRLSMESLASFSSNASATSGEGVEIGNLTFVTDLEMLSIMYEDADESDGGGGGNRATYNSLPPSAILGTGATSMVRLAWRKTNNMVNHKSSMSSFETNPSTGEEPMNVKPSVASLRNLYKPEGKQQSRRSVVRVISKPISENGSQASSKGDLVAVKLIQKSVLKQMKTMTRDAGNRVTVRTAFDNIEKEIAMMKRLQHPNLVRLFEVIDSVESDKLYMVLEYVSLGEILSHQEGTDTYRRMRYKKKVKGLTPGGYFDEENAALYFVDIMHGLAYLHRHGICHRDLKPENILLSANGVAKISDFGVAHVFDNDKDEAVRESLCMSVNSDFLDESERSVGDHFYLSRKESDQAINMPSQHDRGILNKTEGTWCFWAPEMCSQNVSQFSGYATDLWAAGICLFIFTTGKIPFFSMKPLTLFELISKAEVPYDEHPHMTSCLKELLKKMLTKNPAERAGVGWCLQHEFCQDARTRRISMLGKEFEHSESDIVLTNEEVNMAFSVTKLSSMFDKKNKRGHDNIMINLGDINGSNSEVEDDDDDNSGAPETFKTGTLPVNSKTGSTKDKGVLKQRSKKVIKQISESALDRTSRRAREVIQRLRKKK